MKNSKKKEQKNIKSEEIKESKALAEILPSSVAAKSFLAYSLNLWLNPDLACFSFIFRPETGLDTTLSDLLDGRSQLQLGSTNHDNQEIFGGELVFRKLIKEEIGPEPESLRENNEPLRATYLRHRNIILGFAPLTTCEELAVRLDAHPHYNFNQTISNENFQELFPHAETLRLFIQSFPAAATWVIGYVLSYGTVFNHLFPTHAELRVFVRRAPAEYTAQVMGHILSHDAVFNYLFPTHAELGVFVAAPAEYATQVMGHVLSHEAVFNRLFAVIVHLISFLGRTPAEYAAQVMGRVLRHGAVFNRLFPKAAHLIVFLQNVPAEYAAQVMGHILSHEAVFNRLFPGVDELMGFLQNVPAEYAAQVMGHILSHEAVFNRLFPGVDELIDFLQSTAAEYAAQAVGHVLSHEALFKDFFCFRGAYPITLLKEVPDIYASQIIRHMFADQTTLYDTQIEYILASQDFLCRLIRTNEERVQCLVDSSPHRRKRISAVFAAKIKAELVAQAAHQEKPSDAAAIKQLSSADISEVKENKSKQESPVTVAPYSIAFQMSKENLPNSTLSISDKSDPEGSTPESGSRK
jgi:hypothetical protein